MMTWDLFYLWWKDIGQSREKYVIGMQSKQSEGKGFLTYSFSHLPVLWVLASPHPLTHVVTGTRLSSASRYCSLRSPFFPRLFSGLSMLYLEARAMWAPSPIVIGNEGKMRRRCLKVLIKVKKWSLSRSGAFFESSKHGDRLCCTCHIFTFVSNLLNTWLGSQMHSAAMKQSLYDVSFLFFLFWASYSTVRTQCMSFNLGSILFSLCLPKLFIRKSWELGWSNNYRPCPWG